MDNSYSKEDFRKEFVVNMTIGLVIAEIYILYFVGKIGAVELLIAAIPFITLYFLSKIGFYRISFAIAVFYISLITLISSSTSNLLGSLFTYLLVLILVYRILGTKHAMLYLLGFTLALFAQTSASFGGQWLRNTSQHLFLPLSICVALCVGWLPNQRIRESLRKVKLAERLLKQERNMLDIRLKQRTESLFELADLGIKTQKLIHDISTPLNVILMNISKVNASNLKIARVALKRSQHSTKLMTKYIEETKNSITNQNNKVWFSLEKALQTVRYICETEKVTIITNLDKSVELFGNETKFLQMVTNIVQNSVESYSKEIGTVKIKSQFINNALILAVLDKGRGMNSKELKELGKFTSKSDPSLHALGYVNAKSIAEKDFGGTITTESKENFGTKTNLVIKTPNRSGNDHAHLP